MLSTINRVIKHRRVFICSFISLVVYGLYITFISFLYLSVLYFQQNLSIHSKSLRLFQEKKSVHKAEIKSKFGTDPAYLLCLILLTFLKTSWYFKIFKNRIWTSKIYWLVIIVLSLLKKRFENSCKSFKGSKTINVACICLWFFFFKLGSLYLWNIYAFS